MKESLRPGLTAETANTVSDDMAPPHLPVKALSTPSMVGLIERACFACAQPHLDENETTVGTHINVSHSSAIRSGERVDVAVRLSEINKRRLVFGIEVTGPRGSVSTGTHERAVVDLNRMQARSAD